MRAIIISGPPSVGKTTVANEIGKKFHARVLGGGDMLKQIAREKGYLVSGEEWWDTEAGMRFLEERRHNTEFDKKVDEKLVSEAEKGDAVITSYSVPWLTKSGVKLWLKGSIENRAKRMAQRDGIAYGDALKAVARRDEMNFDHYRRLYNLEFGLDLTVFDFVVNTDLFDKGQVVKVCLNLLEEALH